MMDPDCPSYGGRIPWRAPEIPIGEFPSEPSADIYSYGIILWEIVTQEYPYSSWKDMKQLFRSVQRGLRPKIPESCSPIFKELMEQCWDANPKKRPTFHQIIEKLKPYETISATSMSKQLLQTSWPVKDFIATIKNTHKCTELLSFRENQNLSLCWTFYVPNNKKNEAMKIISQDVHFSEYSTQTAGEMILTDLQGKITWISTFKTRENLKQTELIRNRAESLHKLAKLCVTPIILEIRIDNQYSLRAKPSHALVVNARFNNQLRQQTLLCFEEFIVPSLNSDISWCGALSMIERSSNSNTTFYFYTDEIRLDRLIRSGFAQSQLSHLKRFLIDVPIISKEKVEIFTYLRSKRVTRNRSNSDEAQNEILSQIFKDPRRTSSPAKMEVKPR